MPRKLLKFLILFDNTSLLYFPGQFLSGRVLIELQDDTPALGLHFHVVGEGVVRVRTPRQERVYDRENYIDFRMRLLGEPGQGPSVLSPGIHSFPFKLGLPLGLPSTFLGKHGWVQYFCKTALREPNGLTHKNQQVFIVMNPIDLNLEPAILGETFRCEVEHKFGVSCVGSGAVVCKVTLDRGGYVPGESIGLPTEVLLPMLSSIQSGPLKTKQRLCRSAEPSYIKTLGHVNNIFEGDIVHDEIHPKYIPSLGAVTATPKFLNGNIWQVIPHLKGVSASIHNRSRVTIKSTRAALTESITYMARGKIVQSEKRELASLSRGKIKPGEKDQWNNEQLYIPPLPPTNLRGCHLIKINYDVYFIVEPKSLQKEVKLQLPIMMATYPIRSEDDEGGYKSGTHYPSTLPIFRPWLEDKPTQE